MQIFKGPGQAVLDGSVLDEPILIFVDKGDDGFLKPVG
jgi:hypothetical protein